MAVTSPQTRMALATRRAGPVTSLDAEALARARRVRRAQLRVAAGTLVGAALLLVGLPALLDLLPRDWRVGDMPVVWLAVAVLPYPVLATLAWVQLRRAERVE
ncbi:hypothetical protein [Pseudonocardia sp. WMMC193]|uniref:hypothetical protein n=1 Tax=Pseudonocardia sp. WMMC193 TaxID=2911965 RepID=UPI001F235583|nr:hypothetical protein [Pseudonocardia sp. WMMC193]MCF7551076.1 hypothetical protein [Pseudonocardia sp. WMMC193]